MTRATEVQLLENMTKIKQAVLGNGVKGLAQRMADQEEWRDSHPRLCPLVLKRGDILKVRALEISLIAVILTLGQIILRALKVI